MEVPGDGRIVYDAQPVTFDYSDSAREEEFGTEQFERSLHDLVSSNAYRLRRLVGKLFIYNFGDPSVGFATRAPLTQVSSAFIVCRTDTYGNATTDFDSVNPLAQDAANDPWIWRRSWIFGQSYQAVDSLSPYSPAAYAMGAFPVGTPHYHGALDGGHIDAKTARVIGQEERLYWVTAARCLSYTFTSPGDSESNYVHGLLECRALASLKFGSGNKRNASR